MSELLSLSQPSARKRNLLDVVSTLWKNGKGSTKELLRYPSDSDFDSFAIRVSVADVTGDAEFSTYPGVDRCLIVLGGAGMRLIERNEGVVWKTLKPLIPACFPGELLLQGKLIEGAFTDFNLMVRRRLCRGRLDVEKGPSEIALGNDCRLVFIVRGAGSIRGFNASEVALTEFDFVSSCDGTLELTQNSVAIVVRATEAN